MHTLKAKESVDLLSQLIVSPSFSGEEDETAAILQRYFEAKGIIVNRKHHNIWLQNRYFDPEKPTVLLNSHHDTVKPVEGWQRDPFSAGVEGGKLFGLGSNDAGASLVSLIQAFLFFYDREDLSFNLIFVASAEEENSGKLGIASVLPELPKIAAGIVGEPTSLKMAVAEKGLIVIDALVTGKAGHAAREEGENALYKALKDLSKIQEFTFPEVSPWLGRSKATVTSIQAGYQHNIVPDACRFVIDVRTTECYPNKKAFQILDDLLDAELQARSFRLNPSGLSEGHWLFRAGLESGLEPYGSPTLSDQALMDFPTLKLGPGESARSHTADEYIELSEIESGIRTYIGLLTNINNTILQKEEHFLSNYSNL